MSPGAWMAAGCAAVLWVGCASAPSASSPRRAGFLVVYRWQVKPGCDARFEAAWRAETLAYREQFGSLGTRLYRAEDGTWVATAYWPSRARWEAAHRSPLTLGEPERMLEACIVEKREELRLELREDLAVGP